jgi:putative methyltransferase
MRHKVQLNAAVEELKVKRGVSSKETLLTQDRTETVSLPRYVRVNSIKTTLENVVTQFQSEGMQYKGRCVLWPDGIRQVQTDSFFLDTHLDDLLVFSQSMDLHSHLLYTLGHIILQGKASCLPAKMLAPPPGSIVIDACAAPGNKTSHLASLMGNSGKIFAFDLDPSRLATMKKLMHRASVTCAVLKHQNFLKVNPKDIRYSRVEYVIVDPSCSGSGCVTQVERAHEQREEIKGRLQRLQKFQLAALLHAFNFQSVKRIVYSTCSVYEDENEQVVSLALEKCSGKFKLIEAMPDWPHRGLAVFPDGMILLTVVKPFLSS